MTKFKHTGNKWSQCKEKPTAVYTDDDDNICICENVCIDDARLISCAPEMLEALIEFVEISNKYYGNATDTHIFTRSLSTGVVIGIIERATGLPIEEVLK